MLYTYINMSKVKQVIFASNFLVVVANAIELPILVPAAIWESQSSNIDTDQDGVITDEEVQFCINMFDSVSRTVKVIKLFICDLSFNLYH